MQVNGGGFRVFPKDMINSSYKQNTADELKVVWQWIVNAKIDSRLVQVDGKKGNAVDKQWQIVTADGR